MPVQTKSLGSFMAIYRVLRWVVLGLVLLFIFVALRHPAPPSAPLAPQDAGQKLQSFNQKLDQLAAAKADGQPAEIHFDSDEVNSGLQSMMANGSAPNPVPTQAHVLANQTAPAANPNASINANADVPEGVPIQALQVGFLADQAIGQFSTKIYGKDVFITIAGRLGSKDGYVTFDPTLFKVGDLSVPVSMVNDALQKKLADPENHEKLKLPDYISSLRVEDGELVITEK
jgi:hypothetical protein